MPKHPYITLKDGRKVWSMRMYHIANGKPIENATQRTKKIRDRLGDRIIEVRTVAGDPGFPSRYFVPVGTPWCFGAKAGRPRARK